MVFVAHMLLVFDLLKMNDISVKSVNMSFPSLGQICSVKSVSVCRFFLVFF